MAWTEDNQKDLMYVIVGALNVSPGRTIFYDLAESQITGGASLADITLAVVEHPLFSNNSYGEYPIGLTNQQFAEAYMTQLLGEPGDLVDAGIWDLVIDIAVGFLNGYAAEDTLQARADLVLAAVQFLQNTDNADFAAAAAALENKVDVALYQVELGLDIEGTSLDDYRAPIADVDDTQASVDAAKAALDEILNPTLPTVTATVESNGIEGETDVVFKLVLDEAQDEDVIVSISTGDGDDTATPGSDYAALAEQITFAPGETVKFITIPVVDDALYESEETITLNISSSDADVATASVTATIDSDDAFAILKPASEGNDLIDTTQEDPQTILGTNANLNAGDVIEGGPEDTLELYVDGALPGTGNYNFAGFTLNGVGTVQVTNDSGRSISLDMSNSEDVMTLRSSNSTADVRFNYANTNPDSDGDGYEEVNLEVLNLTEGVNVTLDVRNADTAGLDEVNLLITDSDDDSLDAQSVNITAAGGTGGEDEDTDAGIEMVNLSTEGSAGSVRINDLNTPGATDLNIFTETGLTIGDWDGDTDFFEDALSGSVNMVDASGSTGDVALSTEDSFGGVTITGGDGDDVFAANDTSDVIDGGAGDDEIRAADGDNNVSGGLGDDTITSGEDNDTISGDEGDDLIDAGNGDNSVSGGDGDDSILVGWGNDTVTGDDGDDSIDITAGGEDNVSGGDGNDTVDAGNELTSDFTEDLGDDDNGGDTLDGGAGNDLLILDSSNDWGNVLDRVTGFETIDINGGFDLMISVTDSSDFDHDTTATVIDASDMTGDLTFEGNDLEPDLPYPDADIDGGIDDDVLSRSITILGGSGEDSIVTGMGEDSIQGNGGDDTIKSGTGNDTVDGAVGDDSIMMQGGDDLLIVTDEELDGADDLISGGEGSDTIEIVNGPNVAEDYLEIDVFLGDEVEGIEVLKIVDEDDGNDNDVNVTLGSGGDNYDNLGTTGDVDRSVLTIDASELDNGESLWLYAQGLNDADAIDEDVNVIGGEGADYFFFGDNVLDSGDTIDGGNSWDNIYLDDNDSGDARFENVSSVERYYYTATHSAVVAENAENAGLRYFSMTSGDDGLDASAYVSTNVTVYGGAGNDTITTGAGNDYVNDGNGNDVIMTGDGNDYVYSYDNTDDNGVTAPDDSGSQEYINLGAGNDTYDVYYSNVLSVNDTIDGGTGSDTIRLNNSWDSPIVANINLANVTSIENYTFGDYNRDPDAAYNFTLNFIGGNVLTLTNINVDASNLTDDDGDAITVDLSQLGDKDYQFTIVGGSGNDTVIGSTALPENLNYSGGAGDDSLIIDGADLGTTVTTDGGEGRDILVVSSGAMTDDSFVGVSDYEVLTATASYGMVMAQLGEAAEVAGIDSIIGGAGDDNVELDAAFNPASLTVDLSAGGNDTINAGASSTTVTFQADASDIGPGDVLTGGTGADDSIELTADNGTADLSGGVLTGVSNVIAVESGLNTLGVMIDDATFTGVASGIINVDASAFNNGDIQPNGTSSDDNGSLILMAGTVSAPYSFNVTGGDGADNITTGAGDDVIDVGLGDDTVDSGAGDDIITNLSGNNVVMSGAGEDSVELGDGNNYVDAGTEDDVVIVGNGNNTVLGGDGDDTITAGSGSNDINGGAGNDIISALPGEFETTTITGGTGTEVITLGGLGSTILRFETVADSVGLTRDTINGFDSNDEIWVENQATAPGVSAANFAGNAADFSDAIGAISLTASDGFADYVYQQDTNKLWIDVNDDGELNGLDIQITLAGTAAIADGQVSVVDTIAPVFTSAGPLTSLDENSGAGQAVYDADATDYSGVTFSLGGTDAGAFTIDPVTGVVTLTGDPDYEGQASYDFTVIATDGGANTTEQALTLDINNIDEEQPYFDSTDTPSVDENVGPNTVVHTVVALDDLDISAGVTYSITGGTDQASFSINGSTGELTLIPNPDWEGQDTYEVIVTADDGVTTPVDQTITLSINNLDEDAPNITSTATPDVDENNDILVAVLDVDATDPGTDGGPSNPIVYSIGGADAAFFNIDSVTGEVFLNASADHETKDQYVFDAIATDAAGNATTQAVTLTVNDLDEEAPVFTTSDTVLVVENTGANQIVIDVDVDNSGEVDLPASDPVVFSIGGGADAASFSIDDVTGELTLIPNPDYETQSSYEVVVTATDDAGNAADQTITVNIDDVTGIDYSLVGTTSTSFTILAYDESGTAGNLQLTEPVDGVDDVLNGSPTVFTVGPVPGGEVTPIVVEENGGLNTGVVFTLYQGSGVADDANGTGVTGDLLIYGFGGDDTLAGGDGSDTIYGGDGADTIVYSTVSQSDATNTDTIGDFVSGTDVIDLDALFGGGPAAPAAITTAVAALDGTAAEFGGNEIAVYDDGANTTVYVDVSGDDAFGAGDMIIEFTGTGLGLVAGDFLV